MTPRPAVRATQPQPATAGPPPAAPDQHDKPCDHGGHPSTDLDAHIARLAGQAPPLSSEQRDTLALILRRPRRTSAQAPGPGTPDPVPQRVDPFHG